MDNKLLQEADDYIKKHRLIELFEDLATGLAYRKPENMEEFLVDQLMNKKAQGLNSGIFTEQEVHNVFNLFDLKKEGSISKDRCIQKPDKGLCMIILLIFITIYSSTCSKMQQQHIFRVVYSRTLPFL